MQYCENCGAELSTEGTFCADCLDHPGVIIDEDRWGNDEDLDTTQNDEKQDTTQRASRLDLSAYTRGQAGVVAGAIVTIIAALLPWQTFELLLSTETLLGISNIRLFSFFAGLGIIALVLYRGPVGWSRTTAFLSLYSSVSSFWPPLV